MRRFAVVLSALAALMLVWAGAALAQEGCPGSIKTTDASGTVVNQNPYGASEDVYVRGENFSTDITADLTYTITDVNDGELEKTGTIPASEVTDDGNFLVNVWPASDPTRAGEEGHEYSVDVTYVPSDGQPASCTKNDNFFLEEAGGGGGGGTTTGGTTTGGTTTGGTTTGGTTTGGGGAGAGGGGGSLGEAAGGAGAGALPFTGLSVWIVALVGLALIGGGFGLLRWARPDH
jgi:hypothetical protein